MVNNSDHKVSKKSVSFNKILTHEDMVVDALKSINQQQKFKKSWMHDRISVAMGLIHENLAFTRSMTTPISLSAEKFLSTRRGFDPDNPSTEKTTRRTSR